MAETEIMQKRSAKAVVKYVRIQPRKLRLVIDTIRRKPVYQAFAILSSIRKKGARLAEKLLKSVVANARVKGLEEDRLYISAVFADVGPTLKRFRSRSMGRADRVLKRMAHLTMAVSEGQKAYSRPGALAALGAKEVQGAEAKLKKKKMAKTGAGKA